MRKTDVEILHLLQTVHIDREQHGIGCNLFRPPNHVFFLCINSYTFRMTSFKALRKRLGLRSARQQGHTLDTIRDAMVALRKRYPKAGARDMTSTLFHEKGMSVPQ